MTDTPLDQAHAAMDAAPEDDALRLAFYDRLAHAELLLLLKSDPEGDSIDPEDMTIEGAPCLLVFDTEERLAEHAGKAAAYVGLSGRALAGMMAGQGVGLALNLGVAPSSHVLPPEAVDWLAATLSHGPEEVEAEPRAFHAPSLPGSVVAALDHRLASAAGLARAAFLTGVTYSDGMRGHMLVIAGAVPGSEQALAGTVNEALTFSDAGEVSLDVTFLDEQDPAITAVAAKALRFDLPEREAPEPHRPAAPGSDPSKPPRLR
ncbi:SseB family protein [Aquicoccus sp. SCR17]|nr:SseB family protein [Carideicomes alvinocaridis]